MADSRQYNAEDIEGFATTRRTPPEQEVITDDLRSTVIANMMDSINAAWNGWEASCKFEDEAMQDYYMKYINVLSDTIKKVRKF